MTDVWEVWPGRPYPLGARFDGEGVNFAVYSEGATQIEICIYDPRDPRKEIFGFTLPESTRQVRHGYVRGLKPGLLYGLRAHGPWDPEKGLRYNGHKLLVDPYARAIFGEVDPKGAITGHKVGGKNADLVKDERDDAAAVPKAVIVDSQFNWENDQHPNVPWPRTIIYEAHVKGFTKRHPFIPEDVRGTYAGLGHPAAIEHLRSLGVTAIELLPVHHTVDEGFLKEKGLANYWGYSTLGFFAPDPRWSRSGPLGVVDEFKYMVKELHRAGIEVILDVVYNHTAEGNQHGPTLSFRGLDNAAYYALTPDKLRYYQDYTGTGNSFNVKHPQALQLICDSLRYWVEEMHVDGFRFDLATVLGREEGPYDRNAAFFRIVHQDPVLSKVKLIAEPWDVGLGGYQVGNFPADWAEWNGRYRDAVRRYWKGDEAQVGELGFRLTGSSDLYLLSGRTPGASINFITCHDGFTVHDLVTYNHKHNEANKEENRDGSDNNLSWNCGVEGETDDPKIVALRERQKRNFLATLLLSQGVPMLTMGDEMGRTQKGNNNAYCQDNELSWLDWNLDDRRRALLEFTRRIVRLRQTQPVLMRRRFFKGRQIWDSELKDLAWFRPDGKEMTPEDWGKPFVRSLAFLLGGDAIATPDEHGRRVVGDTLLVLMNAHHEPIPFTLPDIEWGEDWELLLDTADVSGAARAKTHAGGAVPVEGRALVVLRRPAKD
jgi:isoamylase